MSDALREALARLVDASEAYSADQADATDPRCGLVQPVSVEEARELNDALEQARGALAKPATPTAPKRWRCTKCGVIINHPWAGGHLTEISHPGPWCGPVVAEEGQR